MRSALALAASLAAAASLSGCGGTQRGPERDARAAQSAPTAGLRSCGATLFGCLPHGAREVLWADIGRVRDSPQLRGLLGVFRVGRDDAFVQTFGFSPGAATGVTWARYPVGQLVLVEGDLVAERVVHRLGERMNTLESADPSPLRRIGFLGAERVEAVAVGERRFAIGWEHAAPTARLVASLRGRSIPRFSERYPGDAPPLSDAAVLFAVDVRGAFPLETPIGAVLAGAEWVSVELAGGPSDVGICARLYGDFPASAAENLRAALAPIVEAQFGGILGISAADVALSLDHDETRHSARIVIRFRVQADALVRAAELVFGSDSNRRSVLGGG